MQTSLKCVLSTIKNLCFLYSSSGIPAGIPELDSIYQSLVPVFLQKYRNWARYSENEARPFVNGAKNSCGFVKKKLHGTPGTHFSSLIRKWQNQNRILVRGRVPIQMRLISF